MATLTGVSPSGFYKDLLQTPNGNGGVPTTSPNLLQDGLGNNTAFGVSKSKVQILPTTNTTNTFTIYNSSGGILLNVDSTNSAVTIGTSAVPVGTNMFTYYLENTSVIPATADTWTAMPFGYPTSPIAIFEFGTGDDPATSFTISANAQRSLLLYNRLAYNIKIDAVRATFTSDTATGDVIDFSLGSYAVDVGNSATSGDLSGGVQIAVSSPVTSAGYEQIYFADLTIATAEVSAGRMLMAHCRQDGTNSDLNARLEVYYHFN